MNLESGKKKEVAIRTLEELGYEIILIKDNRIIYSKQEQDNKYCNNCQFCSSGLLDESPDPFEMTYKLRCEALGGILIAAYEPCEDTKTEKPLACPILGRELTEDEQKEADEWLKIHKI